MRQIAVLSLLFSLPFQGIAQQPAQDHSGLHSRHLGDEAGLGEEVPGDPGGRARTREHEVSSQRIRTMWDPRRSGRTRSGWWRSTRSGAGTRQIEQFDVLYPTPQHQIVEMTAPTKFKLKLEETPLAEDPYTHETKTQLPGYNIYSADGDVTGPLIYANYGMLDDYAELERNGISVKGRDRDYALRRRLARSEAEAGVRAWSDRLHHLLRPGGRWLWPERRAAEGTDASAAGRAARQRLGHAVCMRAIR